MVVNGGKMQMKGEQRKRKRFVGFHRNLLFPSASANSGKF
jgi:hypothetical protein